MRRQFIIVALALLLVGVLTVSADEAVLIDFSLLKADIPDSQNQGRLKENRASMMDFSGAAGASYTEDQKQQMRVSLAIPNWDVVLASSSRTTMTQSLSKTAEVPVPQGAKQYSGKSVLGMRIRFPEEAYNSWARIKPPFEIPAFEKTDVSADGVITKKEDQRGLTRFEGSLDENTKVKTAIGIVKNVGPLKSVAVNVKGLNFPHGLSLVLKDQDGVEKVVFMGYLNFDGWKELRWDNPQYISDIRNRELRIFPLYPNTVPMLKFDGFVVTRDASHEGGDFVAYIKDVKILYDKAVLDPGIDIDDEEVWQIVGKKEEVRKIIESKRFGHQQVMRYLETKKSEDTIEFRKEPGTDVSSPAADAGSPNQAAPAAPTNP